MAIRFLSNVDLTNGELQNFKVQNLAADPSVTGEGQMIYRTDTNQMKYYDGSNWQVISVTGGDITDVNGGTYITTVNSGGPIVTVNHDDTTRNDTTTSITPIFGGSFTAIDTVTTNTTGHVTGIRLQTVNLSAQVYTWNLTADSGTNQTISNGNTVDIAGGTGLTSLVSNTDTVTISLDDTAVTAGTYTSADITVDAQGRITAAADGGAGTMSSWELAGESGTPQVITDGDQVRIVGGTGINTVASSTDILTANLALSDLSTVTTIDPATDFLVGVDGTANEKILYSNVHLDQWGDAEADVDFGGNKILDIATGTAGTDGVNLGQVQSLVAGVGVFQGGYNASTNTPALTGGSNIALTQGDFFAVTVAGSFFTENLEPGDLIFANSDITASSTPSLSDYTVVIADANIAGTGATDGATEKGVAGFDSANFSATANGFITLDDTGVTAASYGSASKSLSATVTAKGLLTSLAEQNIAITASQVTDFCTAVESCISSDLNYSQQIGDGTATVYNVTHSLGSRAVMVQLYDSSGITIYADVERTSNDVVQITFNNTIATNSVTVLINRMA
tara:strand:- start:561 stop:2261 length:1701 start_codon:yes stop_codon:yes gene_type:complete